MELRNKIDKFVSRILVAIMALMVLNVLWQVFTRFFLQNPSSFTDELARYLMIWVGVLGAAYISGRNMHVAIDLLPKKLNTTGQIRIKKIINIIIILFCFAAFVIGGSRLVFITLILNQKSSALQIPLALVYLIIPLSGMLIIYYKFFDLLKKD